VGNKARSKSPYKIDDDKLRSYIQLYPDEYLSEIANHFQVTPSGIPKALSRLEITQKKDYALPRKMCQKAKTIR
jgi:hypothetical protein